MNGNVGCVFLLQVGQERTLGVTIGIINTWEGDCDNDGLWWLNRTMLVRKWQGLSSLECRFDNKSFPLLLYQYTPRNPMKPWFSIDSIHFGVPGWGMGLVNFPHLVKRPGCQWLFARCLWSGVAPAKSTGTRAPKGPVALGYWWYWNSRAEGKLPSGNLQCSNHT